MVIAEVLLPKVLLIGSGQLGSRYLQGLSGIERQLNITVVDPSSAALDVAKQRLADVSPSTTHELHFTTSLDEVPKELDLALVVTPAHSRPDVVSAISSRHQVKAWILEKLLAQSSQDVSHIEKFLGGQSHVWVNTPRRLMHWHQAIKQRLLARRPAAFRARVSGGNWGLACNSIHFIDLVSWWAGSSVDIVDDGGLKDWQPSRRAGFQEVFGSLVVFFGDGSSLELCCNHSNDQLLIEIETPEGIWWIEEAHGIAVGPYGQEISGQLSLQSALTTSLVERILTAGCCELPSLTESAAQHRPLLDVLLKHWNFSQSRHDQVVPIT